MKKLYVCLLGILLLIPIKATALTGTVSITCSATTIAVNDTMSCTIKATSDDTVSGYAGTIEFGNAVTITNFKLSDGWSSFDALTSITSESKLYFTVSANTDPQGNFTIATFDVKGITATESITISLTSNKLYDSNVKAIDLDNTSVTISVSSTSVVTTKGLSSLEVTGGAIGRTFEPDNMVNTSYTVELSSATTQTFGFIPMPKNTDDSVVCKNGHTNTTLTCSSIAFTTDGGNSDMLIYIVVGSGDSEVVYTLAVSKPSSNDKTNNSLSSLTVGGKAATKSGDNAYIVTLNDTSSYSIEATLADSTNYKFDDNTIGFLKPYTFNGDKEIPITVVPKDASAGLDSVTYILTIKSTSSGNSGGNNNAPSNPQTGYGSTIVMSLILVISFIASIYLYKRNLSEYN